MLMLMLMRMRMRMLMLGSHRRNSSKHGGYEAVCGRDLFRMQRFRGARFNEVCIEDVERVFGRSIQAMGAIKI